MYLTCHVTSQDQLIQWSFEFVGENSSWHIVTMISFVTTDIVTDVFSLSRDLM